MTTVKCGDLRDSAALAHRNYRRIDGPEGQIPVDGDELGNSQPISGGDWLGNQVAAGKVPEESDLSFRSKARLEKVGDLGDDEHGHD